MLFYVVVSSSKIMEYFFKEKSVQTFSGIHKHTQSHNHLKWFARTNAFNCATLCVNCLILAKSLCSISVSTGFGGLSDNRKSSGVNTDGKNNDRLFFFEIATELRVVCSGSTGMQVCVI